MTPLATAAGGDIIHPGPRIDTEATVAPALYVSLTRPGLLPAPLPAAVCPLSRRAGGPSEPSGTDSGQDSEVSVLP